MATPTPTSILTPEERIAAEQKQKYDRLTRNLAIGGVIVFPVLAFMPPRKLDLYTFSHAIGFYIAADHLSQQYNGRMLLANMTPWSSLTDLPTEKAKETSRILKEREQLARIRREGLARDASQAKDERGVLSKIWMGGEKEGWKERRMEEERKALAEGKSYASMIIDQVWDVWNWDEKKSKENGSTSTEDTNTTRNDGGR